MKMPKHKGSIAEYVVKHIKSKLSTWRTFFVATIVNLGIWETSGLGFLSPSESMAPLPVSCHQPLL